MSLKKEDLQEFLNFVKEAGIATEEDIKEIMEQNNVERLKTLAYLAMVKLRPQAQSLLASLEIQHKLAQRKESKYEEIISSLDKKMPILLGISKRDLLKQEGSTDIFEELVGD